MNMRYDSPVPPPPKRSNSSMCAPHSTHRKLTPAVNRSTSLNGKYRRKKLLLSERLHKYLNPETISIKSQKTEELMLLGREEINKNEFDTAILTFSTVLSLDNNNLESQYYRGICFYKLMKYRLAIPDFLKVISIDPAFNKYAYYLLANCFEKLNDYVTAIRYISKSIYYFPRFSQGYILRGNFYNLQQRYDKALSDFRKAISINSNDGTALLGMAQSLEKIGDFGTSYRILTQAMNYPDVFASAIIQRAQLFICQKKLTLAINDFNYLLEQNPENAQAYFYKGISMIELGEHSDALLCFEQAIKYDLANDYTSKSIYYLGYLKIKEKDFYGAIHQLDRISQAATPEQKLLRTYAEGVIFLIKRKYKEGIASFLKLLKKKYGNEEYSTICYEYLGFAYCSLRLYSKGLKYLKLLSNIDDLSKASLYNLEIIHGYIAAEKSDYSQASIFFKKAASVFPNKSEPFLLQASLTLEQAYKESPVSENLMLECENLLEKAVSLRKDSETFFYRGILRYLLLKFELALEDAKSCIEKADENIAEHYIFRGLCHASLTNYQDSVNDFSVALQLNESLDYVYNFRGRCAYLMDDSDLAYMDFQKLVNLNDNSPNPYIQTAVVLMHSNSFSGAIASLENANSISFTIEASYLKIKAYILQYEMDLALNELNIILDYDSSLSSTWNDREVLALIYSISAENPKNFKAALKKIDKFIDKSGEIFEKKIILWYKGIFLLYLKKYEEAVANFQQIIEIIQKADKKISTEYALTIEEQNCEILYNIALCYLSTDKKKSIQIFSDLSNILNKKHKGQILFLCSILELELKNSKSAQKYMEDAYKCDPETVSPYLSKQTVILKPLNTTNSLASTFPYLNAFEHNNI